MALEGEDLFENQYYVYNRLFLTIVGLWPYQETSKRLCFLYITIALMITGIIFQPYVLMKSEIKVKQIADFLQICLPCLCFSSTYCNVLYNFATLRKILDRIKIDWAKLMNESELIMMRKYASECRSLCLTVICLFYGYIAILISPTVSCFFQYIFGMRDDARLILPVNNETLVTNGILCLVLLPIALLVIIMFATVGIAYYTMLILFGQHEYALFNILTIKMEQPFSKNTSKFNWTSPDTKRDDEFQWIVEIIKYHDNILNFVDLSRLFVEGSYYVQVFLAFLFIGLDFFYIFQILDLIVPMEEAIRNSMYIVGNLLMIYAGLYLGQQLIDHSSDVYTTCCQLPFYKLSKKTNNLLLLLIIRSIKPCQFSIGGIIVASHELFTKIAKMSFSFATICYKMR